MRPEDLEMLMDEVSCAIKAFRAIDAIANDTPSQDQQLLLPGSESWPRAQRNHAEDRMRRALSSLIIIALGHDRRAAANAALTIKTPRILPGSNVIALPLKVNKLSQTVRDKTIEDMAPPQVAQALGQKLRNIGISTLGALLSNQGLSQCRLLSLSEAEFEALDEIVAMFGARLAPGFEPDPHPNLLQSARG